MRNLMIFIATIICLSVNSNVYAGTPESIDLQKFMSERDQSYYTFPTKFGDVKFVTQDGSLGELAKKITLNGNILIDTTGKQDLQGYGISLMNGYSFEGSAIEFVPGRAKKGEWPITKRMIIFQGPDGNCIKGFTVLDFTGEQPYVSEKFGYNPDDRYCFTLKKAKWGKKESYFYLQGPATYIYYTGARAFGPIE